MMLVEDRIVGTRSWRQKLRGSLGLVPTMGYLHDGHLSLVRAARRENDHVAVSIFVNPTQFGPNEDLSTYPRDVERDLRLLRELGVDLAFSPSVEEIYPTGHDTRVVIGGAAERLEGESRPGHFDGVATVVAKLFNIFTPTRAYFGQKDAQQCAVVQKLVRDLDFGLEVRVEPIVRESDGLAMSSRNVYLNPEERRAALVLSRSLSSARRLWLDGERDAEALRRHVRDAVGGEPLARLDYVSVADPATITELSSVDRSALVLLAARIGRTRLIDNVKLE